jgi:hypothetical protein
VPDAPALLTVAEFGLGLQAWVGQSDFDPAMVGKTAWPTSPTEKPSHGFFTSSWDKESQTSAWMRSRSYARRDDSERRIIVLLKPDPDATLFVVDSIEDFDTLANAYPQMYSNPLNPRRCPNWGGLAGIADAVHVTNRAVTDRENNYAHAWEVESTLWFRGAVLARVA